jgi:hypothetical protein
MSKKYGGNGKTGMIKVLVMRKSEGIRHRRRPAAALQMTQASSLPHIAFTNPPPLAVIPASIGQAQQLGNSLRYVILHTLSALKHSLTLISHTGFRNHKSVLIFGYLVKRKLPTKRTQLSKSFADRAYNVHHHTPQLLQAGSPSLAHRLWCLGLGAYSRGNTDSTSLSTSQEHLVICWLGPLAYAVCILTA